MIADPSSSTKMSSMFALERMSMYDELPKTIRDALKYTTYNVIYDVYDNYQQFGEAKTLKLLTQT